jgi:zinc transporter 9
LHLQNTR